MMAGVVLPVTVVFLVAMVHLSGAAVVASTYSAATMAGKLLSGASVGAVTNPQRCLQLCGGAPACVAFNFNDVTRECELVAAVAGSAVLPGWRSFRMLLPPTARIMDPCASSPCPANKVCVQHWPPSYVPRDIMASLNYSSPGYVCSGHQWLLARRSENKTRCVYKSLVDIDYPNYDLVEKDALYAEALAYCSQNDCLSFLVHWPVGAPVRVYLKTSSPQIAGSLNPLKDVITWYPECR
ncbi:uncharacterized protein LOC125179484 [Hyalella azteca]|uniref:Uncharacterized protein LOC125179484 n=1 Tax=Hyalella azteca TaxID=294128 RepID=A0A979FVW2_HYAAZ|nr:uncharacterized protein LOC125179484 [Hyalella azteca]